MVPMCTPWPPGCSPWPSPSVGWKHDHLAMFRLLKAAGNGLVRFRALDPETAEARGDHHRQRRQGRQGWQGAPVRPGQGLGEVQG